MPVNEKLLAHIREITDPWPYEKIVSLGRWLVRDTDMREKIPPELYQQIAHLCNEQGQPKNKEVWEALHAAWMGRSVDEDRKRVNRGKS